MNTDSTSRGFCQPLAADDPRLPQFAQAPMQTCLDRIEAANENPAASPTRSSEDVQLDVIAENLSSLRAEMNALWVAIADLDGAPPTYAAYSAYCAGVDRSHSTPVSFDRWQANQLVA